MIRTVSFRINCLILLEQMFHIWSFEHENIATHLLKISYMVMIDSPFIMLLFILEFLSSIINRSILCMKISITIVCYILLSRFNTHFVGLLKLLAQNPTECIQMKISREKDNKENSYTVASKKSLENLIFYFPPKA